MQAGNTHTHSSPPPHHIFLLLPSLKQRPAGDFHYHHRFLSLLTELIMIFNIKIKINTKNFYVWTTEAEGMTLAGTRPVRWERSIKNPANILKCHVISRFSYQRLGG